MNKNREQQIKLLVGLPASGKSSYISEIVRKDLDATPPIILTLDSYLIKTFGQYQINASTIEEHRKRVLIVRKFLLTVIEELQYQQFDFIIEDGFFTRDSRSWFVSELQKINSSFKIDFLWFNPTPSELLSRMKHRNKLEDHRKFNISFDILETMSKIFEPPTEAECKALGASLTIHNS
jgi:predicted kinase